MNKDANFQKTKEYWRCPKIYFDESWVKVKNEYTLLIVGALFCPSGSNIESLLELARDQSQCIDTLHSSEISGEKQMGLAYLFLKRFMESSVKFRVIIIEKRKKEFEKYCNKEDWRMVTKAIKLLLNYPYLEKERQIIIIRPKIIVEKDESYNKNQELIEKEISTSLQFNEIYWDKELFRIFPSPIVELSSKKTFESLQLVDILLSMVKWDIVSPGQEKSIFHKNGKDILQIKNALNANNWNTSFKFNTWKFKSVKKII